MIKEALDRIEKALENDPSQWIHGSKSFYAAQDQLKQALADIKAIREKENPKMVFTLHQRVCKTTGDYVFEGVVIGVLDKLKFDHYGFHTTGNLRYAVQNSQGLIHIFSAKQLRAI